MHVRCSCFLLLLSSIATSAGAAQTPPDEHAHHVQVETAAAAMSTSREASGTAWLPDNTPMRGAMWHPGSWMVMLHGNLFLQYVDVGSGRGDRQFGSINWLMAMAERPIGSGRFALRAMTSTEPLTVGRCGYPDLVQSGESCRGVALHDRQHPHDVFMELSARYTRPLGDRLSLELYGGPVGEPAIGPVASPHRPSAAVQPLAPVSHHWLDATHVTFGVVTAGIAGRAWKAEGSVFNGREPDDDRYDLDLGRLDSLSGRVWWLPTQQIALQTSFGLLREADHGEDTRRVTSSLTWQGDANRRPWSNTIAWGANIAHDLTTHAVLAESALDITAVDTISARIEVVAKSAADLSIAGDPHQTFTLTKIQGTYTRWADTRRGVRPGLGAGAGFAWLPAMLATSYGKRAPLEFSVFVVLSPASASH